MKKFVLLLSLVLIAVLFISYSRKKAEFEKHENMIAETNECLGMGDWKCAERNVRELLKIAQTFLSSQSQDSGS